MLENFGVYCVLRISSIRKCTFISFLSELYWLFNVSTNCLGWINVYLIVCASQSSLGHNLPAIQLSDQNKRIPSLLNPLPAVSSSASLASVATSSSSSKPTAVTSDMSAMSLSSLFDRHDSGPFGLGFGSGGLLGLRGAMPKMPSFRVSIKTLILTCQICYVLYTSSRKLSTNSTICTEDLVMFFCIITLSQTIHALILCMYLWSNIATNLRKMFHELNLKQNMILCF